MKSAMNGKMKFTFMALLLSLCLIGFAGEALAASILSARVTKYERIKGSDGIWQIKVYLEIKNNANHDRVVTRIYDVSFNVRAEVKGIKGEKRPVYVLTRNPSWEHVKPDKFELWPGESKTFTFLIRYNSFKGEGWKWEGEERTGKRPLVNLKTSNIKMKYQSKRP